LLKTFAVNHAVDEWNVTYGCYTLKMTICRDGSTVNFIIAVDFLFYFALNINEKKHLIEFK